MAEPLVRIRNVSKRFSREGFEIVALDHINLDIEPGDFFALMGPDNSTPILGGQAVSFPRIGSTNGAIVPLGPTTFSLPTVGTYLVQFQVDVTAAAQLQLSLNTVPLPETVVGRATGTTQIIGVSLVTTTSAGSILQVINPPTNPGLTLPPNDGGTHPISAHLVIIRIQ